LDTARAQGAALINFDDEAANRRFWPPRIIDAIGIDAKFPMMTALR
jgi:hypothetical protein